MRRVSIEEQGAAAKLGVLRSMWSAMGREQQNEILRRARQLLWLQDHPQRCAECGRLRQLLNPWAPKIRVPFVCEECRRA